MLKFPLLWWSLGAALLVVITALSLLPLNGPPMDIPNHDKLNHLIAYVVMMLYFGQLVRPERRLSLAFALLFYGALIECLQFFMPPRSAEWADLAADLLGIVLGWLLLRTTLGQILGAIESRIGTAGERA